jgi:hypothetical protein
VSIIPGIDTRAPERTETSSGSAASPNVLPTVFSMWRSASATSARSSGEKSEPPAKYFTHSSVVIVKPGGTGRPIAAISARFAPLPPVIVLSLARGSSDFAPPPKV